MPISRYIVVAAAEVFLRLGPLAGAPVELAEAEVAMRDERTHAKLFRQLHRASIVIKRGSDLGGVDTGGNPAQQAKGPGCPAGYAWEHPRQADGSNLTFYCSCDRGIWSHDINPSKFAGQAV